MKCALHVHTNLSDGSMFPDQAIEIYADLGFECVAITDHEFLAPDDYASKINSLKSIGPLVMTGLEVDYKPWNYNHLLRILGEKETLHVMAHPGLYHLETSEVRQRIASCLFTVDAVEITARGRYDPRYDVPQITVPKIASDDAHFEEDPGWAWIEMERTRSPDRVINAIKAGDFEAKYNPERMWRY